MVYRGLGIKSPLKLTALHWCQCPTTQIETPEFFPTPPLKSLSSQVEEQLCRVLLDRHLSVSFTPSQQRFQFTWATLNYMVMQWCTNLWMHLPVDGNCSDHYSMSSLWTITVKSCSILLGFFVSTQSLFFYFAISPLYYVLSSHTGGGCPYPE